MRIKPYYSKDCFTLYKADCISILGKKALNDSVNMIFADPPALYNLSNGGISVHAGKRVSVNKGDWDKSRGAEEDFRFHRKWLGLCRNVLRSDGTVLVSGTYHSIYACGYALQLLGYHILNDIYWYKPNAPPTPAQGTSPPAMKPSFGPENRRAYRTISITNS